MADVGLMKSFEMLEQGVEKWNQWLIDDPSARPDLSRIDLSGFDLRGFNLGEASLFGTTLNNANLCGVNLSNANLRGISLINANLCEANLSGVDLHIIESVGLVGTTLSHANLHGANLSKTNLSHANLRGVDLSQADLIRANLSGANLASIQAHGSNFSGAIFTGTCLENWNINSSTKFDGAICKYVYFKANQQERRPRTGTFNPGEFSALFQQAIDTLDLIFVDGLDWQSFFASLQEIRQWYDAAEINIQAVEKKDGGAFVVRLEVSESVDTTSLQQRLQATYEENRQFRSQLLKMEGKLEGYREQLDNFHQKALQGMNIPKYDLRGSQFGGGYVAGNVQGNQYGGTINNYGFNTEDISRLLTALRDQAQAFPTDQKDDANDTLDLLERDLADEQPDQGRIGRRLKKLVEIATLITGLTSGAAAVWGMAPTIAKSSHRLKALR